MGKIRKKERFGSHEVLLVFLRRMKKAKVFRFGDWEVSLFVSVEGTVHLESVHG